MRKFDACSFKSYKAIFFDWDGTAVLSRKSPVEEITGRMAPLLEKGIKLVIISGTTWENIAQGSLPRYFTPKQLQNLYLGLGRGAYNYGFDANGNRVLLYHMLPDKTQKLAVDAAAWAVHKTLFEEYGLCTDIVFSRPNYCKIDLMVENTRGDALYMQQNELDQLKSILAEHAFKGGVKALLNLAEDIAQKQGQQLFATTDAKFLELGLSTKSHNVNYFMENVMTPQGITAADCCFWGDEYRFVDTEVAGSDAQMITSKTRGGDFFDVSGESENLPEAVISLGGQVQQFLDFLEKANL